MTQAEIYEKYYPEWADVYDVERAEIDGLARDLEEESSHVVCPYMFNTRSCTGPGLYWNELACECFSVIQCLLLCPDGQDLDPREACKCVDADKLKKELYPEKVTQS